MPSDKQAKTAIVYCRVSTRAQRDADTIQAQVDTCQGIVKSKGLRLLKYGAKKDGWVIDDGKTGSLLAGRKFAKLVDDLEAGKIRTDYLVVYNLSRIAREDKTAGMVKQVQSATDHARIKAVLRASGTIVLDGDGENDPSTIIYDLKTALAGEEFKLIKQRTMAGRERQIKKGIYASGGRPAYGYRRAFLNGKDKSDGYTLVRDPVDGPRFQQLVQWVIDEGPTHAAREATRAGWPTPIAAKLDPWRDTSIHNMLGRIEVYLGTAQRRVGDGPMHTIKYEPLISQATYQALQRALQETSLPGRAMFLSSGFVDCSCRQHLHMNNSHGKSVATCGATRHGKKACGAIYQEPFETCLWQVVVNRLLQIEKSEQQTRQSADPYGDELRLARQRDTEVLEQIGRLSEMFLAGLDKGVWENQNQLLNAKKAAAQAEVARLEREREKVLNKRMAEETIGQKVSALLDSLVGREPTLEEKRKMLRDLLGGQRAIVTWGDRKRPDYPMVDWLTITLPPWGTLPPLSMRSDKLTMEASLHSRVLALGAAIEPVPTKRKAV